MTNATLLLSRILLSFMFIPAGLQKFGDLAGTAGYIASVGLPMGTVLAPASGIFEALAGIAVLIGFQTRIASWLLALFCAFTALMFHYVPGDMMQMMTMTKNLAIAGGFLALAVAGAGAWSVDGWRGTRTYAHA